MVGCSYGVARGASRTPQAGLAALIDAPLASEQRQPVAGACPEPGGTVGVALMSHTVGQDRALFGVRSPGNLARGRSLPGAPLLRLRGRQPGPPGWRAPGPVSGPPSWKVTTQAGTGFQSPCPLWPESCAVTHPEA